MVTGGIAPNNAGRVAPMAAMMTTPADAARHREITEAVHRHDGSKIAMQILHSGRYGYHPFNVAPSAKKAPIGWFTPKALSVRDIEQTVDDFVRCASLAEEAGYDGVEVMGSEGYLINQFIAARTNARTDEWGGSFANRTRLATTIVERVRAATRPDFILMFRLSMLDLVENGSDWQEVLALAQAIESAGASLINTGIGWHEARIPTIAASVPRGGFSWVTAKLRGSVSIPLVATNRINTPEIAEAILDSGAADLVSMARPFLADPFLLTKAAAGTPERINTCIACNQACLDHSFQARIASCLVNPKAGYETELVYDRTASAMKLAVVGAGPAGLAFSTVAAGRGHEVTLYESSDRIGGQFNLAKQVPGKEEFYETLRCACSSLSSQGPAQTRHTLLRSRVCKCSNRAVCPDFAHELLDSTVDVKLGTRATAEDLLASGYDAVVLATGVAPRPLEVEGADHPSVVSYIDVLTRRAAVGQSVAVVGAGGIGFDVAEFLAHNADSLPPRTNAAVSDSAASDAGSASAGGVTAGRKAYLDLLGGAVEATPRTELTQEGFLNEWGIDGSNEKRGGLMGPNAATGGSGDGSPRKIYLLQRKKGKHGAGLGKTTGWIHRSTLKQRGVEMLGGLKYVKVDDNGLHVQKGSKAPLSVLPVDTIVVCAGQTSESSLEKPLTEGGLPVFKIGGAHLAAELDAKRAIDQASRLAAAIEKAKPDQVDDYVAPLGASAWLFQKLTSGRGS